MILLTTLLLLLSAPSFPGTDGVRIAFQQDGPPGVYGVACDASFRAVPGHAQGLCEGMPDRSVVIYPDEIGADRLLLNVLRHEAEHLRIGAVDGDSAWERFQEGRAYVAGCRYSWVPMCKGWVDAPH